MKLSEWKKDFKEFVSELNMPRDDYKGIIAYIDEVPTTEAARGHWVEEPDRKNHWHCSQCWTAQGIVCMAMRYCPHCGAKMED